jgi:hypothetical protein
MSVDSDERFDAIHLDVIAERTLAATIDGSVLDVFVRFGKPIPYPKGDWACPYQIVGIGDEKVHSAFGIDAVQALQLAMFAAGAVLNMHRKRTTLAFLGESHCGFPSTTREATGSCPYCKSGDAE